VTDFAATPTDLRATLPGLIELSLETQGDPRICVAVLDGPVDQSHPCFEGAQLTVLPALVLEPAGEGVMSAHGTHIASLIFGQPGTPVRGIAPGCRGLIVPIFSDETDGPASQLDLARAINTAVDGGAQVINISGGELSNSAAADPILVNAVRNCSDAGVLVVAAAGNDACRCLHVPAALPSVLAVGATDAQGAPLASSNWGDAYQSNGILAPGENIPGAAPGGRFRLATGTSFATPVVSAVVALLLSLQLKYGIEPDPQVVRSLLLASAIPCDSGNGSECQRFLSGHLNIPGALALISNRRRILMSEGHAAHETAVINEAVPAHAAAGVTSQADMAHAGTEAVTASAVAEACSQQLESQPPGPGIQAAVATRPGRSAAARPGVVEPAGGGRIGGVAATTRTGSISASECACSAGDSKRYVFAIGVLGYDFGTEARRDGFKAQMPAVDPQTGLPFQGGDDTVHPYPANPYDSRQMVNYLAGFPPAAAPYPIVGGFPTFAGGPTEFPGPICDPPKGYPPFAANIADAAELIWTLNIELTPIYAIRPAGTYSAEAYQRLVQFLSGQVRVQDDENYVSRVSIPGSLTNETVTLFSGQVIPVIVPNLRLMYAWNENALVAAAIEAVKTTMGSVQRSMSDDDEAAARKTLRDMLDRLYYDLRNLGQTAAERAMNFAATNAFQFAKVAISEPVLRKMQLADIQVERSSFCRKDSECMDVKLRFFNPINLLESLLVHRFTIDVSDVNPVAIGPMRSWYEAGGLVTG
jgi:hypothetical protein